jgi:gamma-glutamyltranspeptidase/glutathione hydrolase
MIMRNFNSPVTLAVFCTLLFSNICLAQQASVPNLPDYAKAGQEYMVATDHPLASAAGAKILEAGGNAFDAAVAVSFALGVVRPYSTGIGGGGFALLKNPDEEPIVIDFRETAPAACYPEEYLDEGGTPIPGKSTRGTWSVGVPGTLKGAEYVLQRFGSLSLQEVIAPALELAENGFPVDSHTNMSMNALAIKMQDSVDYPLRFRELYDSFLRDGEALEVGDVIKRPALAATLRLITEFGSDALYAPDGALHQALIQYMEQREGPMTSADLVRYSVKVREPLRGRFRGFETWTMPPPSSGGAVITEVLNAVEQMDQLDLNPLQKTRSWPHYLVECFKHAFADRASGLGDLDFDTSGLVHSTIERMLDSSSAGRIAEHFNLDSTYGPEHYGSGRLAEDHGTSHFCVVDSEGRAVTWSETINLVFGSYCMIPGTGIVLNDELDDFTLVSGIANEFELIQSNANLIGPGKRPLSSMSPTIITRNGELTLLAGGSGGPRIITGTLHVILNMLELDKTAFNAVLLPRYHHQWRPDEVKVEMELSAGLIAGFVRRGHKVALFPGSPGIIQVIDCRDGSFLGVSDPRKGGQPAGR